MFNPVGVGRFDYGPVGSQTPAYTHIRNTVIRRLLLKKEVEETRTREARSGSPPPGARFALLFQEYPGKELRAQRDQRVAREGDT